MRLSSFRIQSSVAPGLVHRQFPLQSPTRLLVILLASAALLTSCNRQFPATLPNATGTPTPSSSREAALPIAREPDLTPAPNWQTDNHIHGITVNPDNPNELYIGTHHGLVKRSDSGDWLWASQGNDYMGIVGHPTDGNRLYASGHPPEGGNLGFLASQNAGQSWEERSLPGVDFHALAIAPSQPNTVYGFATSGLQGFLISQDEGKIWNTVAANGLDDHPFGLAVDPTNPRRVLATTRSGVYETTDAGKNWSLLSGTDIIPIAGLTFTLESGKPVLYGYRFTSPEPQLSRSTDNGKTWNPLGNGTEGMILYLAIAPSQPQILYAANDANQIFRSPDGGTTWKRLN